MGRPSCWSIALPPAHPSHTATPPAFPLCRYDHGGAAQAAEALSRQGGGGRSDRRVCIAQIKEEGLGLGEKPDYVLVGGAWAVKSW